MGKCQAFMLSLYRRRDGHTDRRTDRRTTVKQYAPDLSIRGNKNVVKIRKYQFRNNASIVNIRIYCVVDTSVSRWEEK